MNEVDKKAYRARVRALADERRRLRAGGGEGSDDGPPAPRRLTLSNVVEMLLSRNAPEHSSVDLTRNAKGETQIAVTVRTGDVGGIETVEEAAEEAARIFDQLRARYPMATGFVGAAEEGAAHRAPPAGGSSGGSS